MNTQIWPVFSLVTVNGVFFPSNLNLKTQSVKLSGRAIKRIMFQVSTIRTIKVADKPLHSLGRTSFFKKHGNIMSTHTIMSLSIFMCTLSTPDSCLLKSCRAAAGFDFFSAGINTETSVLV